MNALSTAKEGELCLVDQLNKDHLGVDAEKSVCSVYRVDCAQRELHRKGQCHLVGLIQEIRARLQRRGRCDAVLPAHTEGLHGALRSGQIPGFQEDSGGQFGSDPVESGYVPEIAECQLREIGVETHGLHQMRLVFASVIVARHEIEERARQQPRRQNLEIRIVRKSKENVHHQIVE